MIILIIFLSLTIKKKKKFLSLMVLPTIKTTRKTYPNAYKRVFFFFLNDSNHIQDSDDNDIISSKPHLMNQL